MLPSGAAEQMGCRFELRKPAPSTQRHYAKVHISCEGRHVSNLDDDDEVAARAPAPSVTSSACPKKQRHDG